MESANKYIVTEFDINNLFNRAGKILGDGLHMAYWIKHSARDHVEVKVEVIVLVNDAEAMKRLNEFAENEFDNLYEANKRAISQLKEARRSLYDKLLFSSEKPVAVPWQLPSVIDFSLSADAATYEKHLFVDDNGRFKISLNTWEREVLSEELARGAVAWLRNLDRKSWSLEVPYEKAGVVAPMYPDLIIVRKDGHGIFLIFLNRTTPAGAITAKKQKDWQNSQKATGRYSGGYSL
jgi:type III restriction enzyme